MSHSMKPLMLVLLMLFPIVLFAQQGNPSFSKEISAAADAAPVVSTAGDDAAWAPEDLSAAGPYHPDANAQQQSPAQAPPPSPPPGVESRPKIPGSMVGYIDNPIVQNQIRIRFDAAFEDQFPDRSEFFYAKCSCFRSSINPDTRAKRLISIPMLPDRAPAYPQPSTSNNSS